MGQRRPKTKTEGSTTEPLWTADEVAAYLRLTARNTRTRLVAIRRLGVPFLRVGARVRFAPDEVRAWARSQGG